MNVPVERVLGLLAVGRARNGEIPLAEAASVLGVEVAALPSVVAGLAALEVPPFGPDDVLDVMIDGDWLIVEPPRSLARALPLAPADAAAVLAGLATLSAGAPPELVSVCRAAARRIREALAADMRPVADDRAAASAWATDGDHDPAVLSTLRTAVSRRRELLLRYYNASRDAAEERRVRPMTLVQHTGRWYLVAWCVRARSARRFHTGRIEHVDVLDASFEPIDVDVASLRTRVFFEGAARGVQLRVRFDEDVVPRVRSWFPAATRDGDAWTVPGATVPLVVRNLLRFGGGWEVLDPPDAVRTVRAWTAALGDDR